MNKLCDKVYAISEAIKTAPADGLVGVIERAMAVYYWYGDDGSEYTEGDMSDEAVRDLVNAVWYGVGRCRCRVSCPELCAGCSIDGG